MPPAFEKTAVLSVRAGDVGMERTNEAVLALKGYTAYRDLSEEGKQWVAQVDGFLFASQKQDSLTVGNKTFDPATLDVLRINVASHSLRTVVPRAERIIRCERLRIPWRLPDWPAITLPVALSLKRFFAPLLVFIFGISYSLS